MELLWVLAATATLNTDFPAISFEDPWECAKAARETQTSALNAAGDAVGAQQLVATTNAMVQYTTILNEMKGAVAEAESKNENFMGLSEPLSIKSAKNIKGLPEPLSIKDVDPLRWICVFAGTEQANDTKSMDALCMKLDILDQSMEEKLRDIEKTAEFINVKKIEFTCVPVPKG